MNAESLIFDIDGTLWDSRALVAQGYNMQLRAEGYDSLRVTAEDLTPLFGKVMTEIADAILAPVPAPARYALMDRCVETENRYLRASRCDIGYPAVRQTLTALAKNHRLFIVSNSQRGYPEVCMEKLGVTELFAGHLCFGDTGTDKGRTLRTLMARWDIKSAVYIGDTQGDYEAASAAGIPLIWAAYGFGRPVGYAGKIHSFAELTKVLA